MFFLSAWMFFLGILVGRGTVPVNFDIQKLQRQIAELKEESLRDEQNKVYKIPSDTPAPQSVLKFYDVLRREGRSEDPLESINPKPVEPPEEKSETVSTEEKKVSSSPASEKAAAPDGPKTSVQEKTPPAAKSETILRNYSIQVASSKDRKEADKLVEIYKKKGYPAYRDRAELKNGEVWHRVRIGPYKANSEAQKVLGLVKKERSGALILQH